MAPTINHIDAVNLFVGNDDPTNSQHLVLHNVKLPTLTEKERIFAPAGAPSGVKLGMRRIEAPDITFKLEGLNPKVQNLFMKPQRQFYTMRANVRDVTAQVDIPFKAIIQARMSKVDTSEFGGDDGVQTDYALTEIVYYQTFFDNEEQYYLNVLEGMLGFRVDGVEVFRSVAVNLGLV